MRLEFFHLFERCYLVSARPRVITICLLLLGSALGLFIIYNEDRSTFEHPSTVSTLDTVVTSLSASKSSTSAQAAAGLKFVESTTSANVTASLSSSRSSKWSPSVHYRDIKHNMRRIEQAHTRQANFKRQEVENDDQDRKNMENNAQWPTSSGVAGGLNSFKSSTRTLRRAPENKQPTFREHKSSDVAYFVAKADYYLTMAKSPNSTLQFHVVVDHSNVTIFSGISRMDSLPKDFLPIELRDKQLCDPVANRMTALQRPLLICFQSSLPPYQHSVPRFVDDYDKELFHMQPKNVMSMQPGWMNTSWETCFYLHPQANAIQGHIQAGDMWSFQHWHDNALGLVYQTRQAFNMLQLAVHPCRFDEFLYRENPRQASVIEEEWAMAGFPLSKLQKPQERNQTVNFIFARHSVSDKDQTRVHPEAVRWLMSKFPPQSQIDKNKVVWISRQGASVTRQFRNESQILEYLRQRLVELEYFHPASQYLTTVKDLRDRLVDSCMIIGVHGGQLYNQFFANTNTAVLELMPVAKNRWITDQKTLTVAPIAQRAIWHNANIIGQPYWRIHFLAEKMTNFHLTTDILEKIIKTVKLAGCQVM